MRNDIINKFHQVKYEVKLMNRVKKVFSSKKLWKVFILSNRKSINVWD